ncbi:MAG: hypothetical protein KAX05_12275 [Bacteroidales bacterium]|nr:hypothetical protein [Bacteroidales bacterium]
MEKDERTKDEKAWSLGHGAKSRELRLRETCQGFPEEMPVAGKPGRVWEQKVEVRVVCMVVCRKNEYPISAEASLRENF